MRKTFIGLFVVCLMIIMSACTRNEDRGFSINERLLNKDCTSEINDYIVRLWRAATTCAELPDIIRFRATKARLIAYNPKDNYGIALVELEVRVNISQEMRDNPRLYFNQIKRTLDEEHWNQLLSYADHPPKITLLLGLMKIEPTEKHLFDSKQEKFDAYQTAKVITSKIGWGLLANEPLSYVYSDDLTSGFLYGENIEKIQRIFTNNAEGWRKKVSNSPAEQGNYPYLSDDLVNLNKVSERSNPSGGIPPQAIEDKKSASSRGNSEQVPPSGTGKPSTDGLWITGTVLSTPNKSFYLFRLDKPVRGNPAGDVVFLGVDTRATNLLPVYEKAAEKRATLRLYGKLIGMQGEPQAPPGAILPSPVPNVQFITWKIHSPEEPDN